MPKSIWIAGGTTEGRELATYLLGKEVHVYVSVATAYGASLLPQGSNITIISHRMDYEAMAAFAGQHAIDLVIDATHPYAAVVTENIKQVCAAAAITYIRVIRPASQRHDYIAVSSMEEAVEVLGHTEGPAFLTTGSKDLAVFTTLPAYAERIALRILSSKASLCKALELGYDPSHIVCMQGPFDKDLNLAMFRHFHAAYVVTKDSGTIGGFEAKIEAAAMAGAKAIVITRAIENGEGCDAVCHLLDQYIKGNPMQRSKA